MTTPAPSDPTRPEDIVRAVVAGMIELARALREEVARVQDDAERFVGRVKGALARSLKALHRALVATAIATFLFAIGAIVLAIFLVAVLNAYVGDPWGTGIAALAFLAAGALYSMRARSSFRQMEREAAALADRPRR